MTRRPSATLVTILAAGLCAGVACEAVAKNTTPPPVKLRVVAYNVLTGFGTVGSVAYNGVADMITTRDVDGAGPNKGLNPDIVCFEELDWANQAALTQFRDANLPGYQIFTGVGDTFNYNGFLIRGDITVLDFDTIRPSGAPRDSLRVTVQVPGALKTLTVYGVHFKCCSAASDISQRTAEANTIGRNIYLDRTLGLDLDDNGSRETPCGNLIAMGDMNSNNNSDGSLNGMFTSFIELQPTGMNNLPVEHLSGRADNTVAPTFWTWRSSGGSISRLDYCMLDPELVSSFDAGGNGFPIPLNATDQGEVNQMGFVYNSTDSTPEHAPGQWANGNSAATGNASDHRPLVFDLRLARNPATWDNPCDVDNDGDIDAEDLVLWENRRALNTANDVDLDNDVDSADQALLRTTVRASEIADVGVR